MATTYQTYPSTPGGFNFDYRTPPHTPASGGYAYYSPRQYVHPSSTPSKGHTRRATGDGTTYTYTYASTPRKETRHSTTPQYTTSAQSTPQRRTDYVSSSDRRREGPRAYRDAGYGYGREDGVREREYSSSKHYSSSRSKHYVHDDGYDRSFEYLPRYEQYEPQPPAYSRQRHQSYRETRADHRYHDQIPIYTPQEPRTRRSSHTATRPTQPQQPPPRRPTTANKESPKATEDDARRAGIPAGYSYKNWDPTEEPILLLGSVFDANSLGKWIYDWTVFFYGPATPMSEIAGEMWLLLIQLAHKVKRAEDCMPRIRATTNRDLVDDFLESGERLWQRFNKLLKICENFMWKAAKKEGGAKAEKVTMGKNAGCAFVDAIFGRDRELERTEKLMTGIRIWSMRFDANCEEILRKPGM